jgi:putative transposase
VLQRIVRNGTPVGSWKCCERWCATVLARADFAEANERLRVRLRQLAEERRQWGYRRLHILLEREGWQVNSKRVYRIYVEEKLLVRKRKRRRRICAQARVLLAAPARKNETWTMDFLQDALATGRKVRTLAVEDAYTREMLAIEVDTSLPRCAWSHC